MLSEGPRTPLAAQAFGARDCHPPPHPPINLTLLRQQSKEERGCISQALSNQLIGGASFSREKEKPRENLRHVNSSAEEDSMAVSCSKSLKKFPLVS